MTNGNRIALRFQSNFDMLDFVQIVCDRVGRLAGFDDDSQHWVGVAVRESVINAIKHGNREAPGKSVTVEFALAPTELVVSIVDEGEGFEPEEVADPLAPENLLKSSGRGIFFMRSFMDDVTLRRLERGMEVRLTKRLPCPSPTP